MKRCFFTALKRNSVADESMIKQKTKKVLHITPHLGGGVGQVLLNYLARVAENSEFDHRVISLEYANDRAKTASASSGFALQDRMSDRHEKILADVARADIVLIHWWNHPLLYAFLVRESLPPARVIFWSHISGYHLPYVFSPAALTYPDLFVFTSPLSLDVPDVKALPDQRQSSLRVVWSTGGVEDMLCIERRPHDGFQIGYIGTVDYSKLHPRFIQMSGRVEIPGARFTVCGGPSEKQIEDDARRRGFGYRFTFTGQISDVKKYLSAFDVFGYPLALHHYGTCEQSLGESMAAGIPPVVMANKTESFIVEDGVTGLIAATEEAYARAIESLYRHPDLRKRLAENARTSARKRYSLDLMIERWENIFSETAGLPKKQRRWEGGQWGGRVSAAGLFVESLGDYAAAFRQDLRAQNPQEREKAKREIKKLFDSSPIWRSDTKGTANHYALFFPQDERLQDWRSLAARTDTENEIKS